MSTLWPYPPDSVLDDSSTDGRHYGRAIVNDVSRSDWICDSQKKGLAPEEIACSFNVTIRALLANGSADVKLVMGITPRWLPMYMRSEAVVVADNLFRQGLIRSPNIEALSDLENAKGIAFDFDALARFSARRISGANEGGGAKSAGHDHMDVHVRGKEL